MEIDPKEKDRKARDWWHQQNIKKQSYKTLTRSDVESGQLGQSIRDAIREKLLDPVESSGQLKEER